MYLPETINLVNQDDMKSCSIACLAMLTDNSLRVTRMEISTALGMEAPLNCTELIRALCFYRLYGVQITDYEEYLSDAIYILSVDSLNSNVKGRLHNVILDTRGGESIVYDPQKKRVGMKWYNCPSEMTVYNRIKVFGIKDI